MLRIKAPDIKAGTDVIWEIKSDGQEVGTYHSDLDWLEYETAIAKPTDRVIFWRSDYSASGGLARTYTIKATYTDPDNQQQVAECELKSRNINANNLALKTGFHTDVDMLQRLMIQVHYLDKGRLSTWEPGLYLKNNEGTGSYYTADDGKSWSKVADEVQNFRIFALYHTGSNHNLTAIALEAMYHEFDHILDADLPNLVSMSDPSFTTWRDNAIQTSGLGVALQNLEDSNNTAVPTFVVVHAHIYKESWGGKHCFPLSDAPALVRCNVLIAENTASGGNWYTDGGLGFLQVQPYNQTWGGNDFNLYLPADNLLASTTILEDLVTHSNNPGANVVEELWWGFAAYNGGTSVFDENTAAQLRDKRPYPAGYADDLFDELNLTKP